MEQSGQRNAQIKRNNKFIIRSSRNWIRESSIFFFSALVWVYSLTVIYFFVDALFDLGHTLPKLMRSLFNMNSAEVVSFSIMILALFALIFILLWCWSLYNRRKFGRLDRRSYPASAKKEDMMTLDMIDEETYEILQESRAISFDKNPVKRK